MELIFSIYSYLSATIGSSREAFMAGHKPAVSPTILQITIPVITQPQGTTKPVDNTIEKMLPTRTPNIIPKMAPSKLIIMDSNKNWLRILFRVPPKALMRPTSLVRSLTATSIMFISPMAAPISVIKPIAPAEPDMLPNKLIIVVNKILTNSNIIIFFRVN